jgi:hypothetical protein
MKLDFGRKIFGQIFTLEFRAIFHPPKQQTNVYVASLNETLWFYGFKTAQNNLTL